MRRIAVFAVTALTLSACAGEKVWMRSGAGPVDAANDEMDCAAQAEGSGVSFNVGGGAELQTDRFSQRYACLRSRGYKLVPLTAEESAKLKSLGGMEKDDYWRQLLAKNGFGAPPPAGPPPTGPAPAQ